MLFRSCAKPCLLVAPEPLAANVICRVGRANASRNRLRSKAASVELMGMARVVSFNAADFVGQWNAGVCLAVGGSPAGAWLYEAPPGEGESSAAG